MLAVVGAVIINKAYAIPFTLFYTEWGADATLGFWGALLGTVATIVAIYYAISLSNDDTKSATENQINALQIQTQVMQMQDEYNLLVKLTREYLDLLALPTNEDFYLITDDMDTATYKRLLSHHHKVKVAFINFGIVLFGNKTNKSQEDREFQSNLSEIHTKYLKIYNEYMKIYEKTRMIGMALDTDDNSEINSFIIDEFFNDVIKNPNAEERISSLSVDAMKKEADTVNEKIFSFSDCEYIKFTKDAKDYLSYKQNNMMKLINQLNRNSAPMQ